MQAHWRANGGVGRNGQPNRCQRSIVAIDRWRACRLRVRRPFCFGLTIRSGIRLFLVTVGILAQPSRVDRAGCRGVAVGFGSGCGFCFSCDVC